MFFTENVIVSVFEPDTTGEIVHNTLTTFHGGSKILFHPIINLVKNTKDIQTKIFVLESFFPNHTHLSFDEFLRIKKIIKDNKLYPLLESKTVLNIVNYYCLTTCRHIHTIESFYGDRYVDLSNESFNDNIKLKIPIILFPYDYLDFLNNIPKNEEKNV